MVHGVARRKWTVPEAGWRGRMSGAGLGAGAAGSGGADQTLMADPIQKKLQGELEKYQQLQKDLSKSMAARQKLEAQLTENNIVKEELGLLDATNTIYKLIGPVLVKQDMDEAKATVSKRLDYIAGEIKRYELQMQESEKKAEQQREVLARLQQEYQRAQGKGATKA
ncbi:prefoldin subunit 6 [Pangshura tecta]